MLIKSLGVALPPDVWDNARVTKELRLMGERLRQEGATFFRPEDYETSPAWIEERTGFLTRRIVRPGVSTSDLGSEAGGNALSLAGLTIADVDVIICATVTPDNPQSPPVACLIQKNLKSHLPPEERKKITCPAFDITDACNTFVAGLHTAYAYLAAGIYRRILLVAADVMSSMRQDRTTFPIFADAGTALVLEADPNQSWLFNLGADGDYEDRIKVPAGGSRKPLYHPSQLAAGENILRMEGNKVFKEISGKLAPAVMLETLKKHGLILDDIAWFFFHQANCRMVNHITEKLGIGARTYNTGDHFSNTTAASLLLGLWEAWQKGFLKKGQKVMLVAFGGGYTWGIVIFDWPL